MVNYSNGKVYKIEPICEHNDADVYFGSTTKQYLSQRMDQHRGDFNRKAGMCSSKILFEKFGVENCVIVLLEAVSATTNDELRAVEAKYILKSACVNKNIPLRTKKEWRADNAEKIKQYQIENAEKIKQYQVENAEKIKEYKKEYAIENAEKIKEYKREYAIENAEKIKEAPKEYAIKNAGKIK
jgi:hypothetical protein